jgi:uncharacterized damage-inducible protein DinB
MSPAIRPASTDYSPSFAAYVGLITEDEDILTVIESQSVEMQKLLASLDEEKARHRYAEGKWSVREVLGHMIDSEQIMAYRALSIARGETESLPGYDENVYVENAKFDAWKLGDLAEHYALVRRSTVLLFRNLPDEAWERRGTANENPITTRALAWVIAGHERHHRNTLRDRYGV